jgi:hypothetical protein
VFTARNTQKRHDIVILARDELGRTLVCLPDGTTIEIPAGGVLVLVYPGASREQPIEERPRGRGYRWLSVLGGDVRPILVTTGVIEILRLLGIS